MLTPLTYVTVGNCSLRCSTSGTPDRSILGVVMRFERTCSLHHSYGYGYGREHVQNTSTLRDFVHGRTYASKTGVERSHFAKATAPRQLLLHCTTTVLPVHMLSHLTYVRIGNS